METNVILTARPRTELGKGPARRLRRQGLLPAVFYGRRQEPRPLTVDSKDLKTMFSGSGTRSLIRLRIEEDGSTTEKMVMLKDHQIDPIKRSLVHADFYEVDLTRQIEIEVPLILKGKPVGVEKGGLLQQIRHDLLVSALPQTLPDRIEVDVRHLDMGDSVHIEEVGTPEGVSLVYDVNFTLATVIAPKGLKAEMEAEGEEGEGEEPAEAPADEEEQG